MGDVMGIDEISRVIGELSAKTDNLLGRQTKLSELVASGNATLQEKIDSIANDNYTINSNIKAAHSRIDDIEVEFIDVKADLKELEKTKNQGIGWLAGASIAGSIFTGFVMFLMRKVL